MLVVNCPHCRNAVIRGADGTCPACGRPIPLATVQPSVVQADYHDSGRPGGSRNAPDGRPAGPPTDNVTYAAMYAQGTEHPIIRFQRQLVTNTPRVYVTQLMVAINVALFALMVLQGANPLAPDGETLIGWGANYGSLTLSGQWWRLLTCMYLHGGLVHIAINMWVLWDVGRQTERLTGNVGFLVMYLLSGLFGSLASVYWNPSVFSVGASGAVFGVVGALMGFLLPRGESVPKPFLSSLKRSGVTFLIYNVIIGLTIPRIDMAAHAGGFVAGVICGLLMSHPLHQVSSGTRRIRNLATSALGTLGLALAIWQAPAPPADFRGGVNALSDVEQQVEDTFDEAYERFGRGEISEREFARVLNEEVLQPWQAALADFNQLDASDMTAEQQQAVAKLREYLQQHEQKWEALADVVTTLIQFSELQAHAIAFSNEIADQVKRGELSNADWAATIDSQILPPWQALRERLEESNFQLLPDRARQLAEKKTQYMRLREEAWQSLIVALRIDDEDMLQEYQEKTAAAEAIAEEVKAAQSAALSD